MLHHSFSHIPSVGAATELKIWNSGVHSMNDFVKSPPSFLSGNRRNRISHHIELSLASLGRGEATYFYENLPPKEQWRIFREYQDAAAYIDIETTGLGGPGDIITTIALYDGTDTRYYVNGENLDDFIRDISRYKLIITYNGKTFDVPFIERFFGVRISHCHLDLRYILNSLGFSGGLKSCEKQLGIERPGGLEDVDGFFAVLLWNDYVRSRNRSVLETLLSYNIEDVLNLERLMIEAYNRKVKDLPFKTVPLKMPERPENLFQADASVVRRIRSQSSFTYGWNRY